MVGHISLAYIYHSRRPGAEEVSEEHIRRERDCEKIGFLDNFNKGDCGAQVEFHDQENAVDKRSQSAPRTASARFSSVQTVISGP